MQLIQLLTLAAAAAVAETANKPLKFDFSEIHPTALYTPERGYGFESGRPAAPPFFSVRVPEESNYLVTVTLGYSSAPAED